MCKHQEYMFNLSSYIQDGTIAHQPVYPACVGLSLRAFGMGVVQATFG